MRDWAPGLYIEAGAMRIPRVHDLTLEYCNLFGLQLRPFVMGNANAFVYVGGERMTMAVVLVVISISSATAVFAIRKL